MLSNGQHNSTHNHASHHAAFARKRLMRDYNEILEFPLQTVYAEPLEENIFVWYANILAPETSKYYGICLHLRFEFPYNYPDQAPNVQLLTPIQHFHVFGRWICLDILESRHFRGVPYHGWSTAYSCLTILLQLQSFLFEEEDFISNDKIVQDIYNSLHYRLMDNDRIHHPYMGLLWPCSKHWKEQGIPLLFQFKSKSDIKDHVNYISKKTNTKQKKRDSLIQYQKSTRYEGKFEPKKSTKEKKKTKTKKSKSKKPQQINPEKRNQIYTLDSIPDEVLLYIFEFLSYVDLKQIESLSERFQTLANSPLLWEGQQLICYYTKYHWSEDTLGIGIEIEKIPGNKVNLHSPLDLVSQYAFFYCNVRISVWGVQFQEWCPVFINRQHFDESLFQSCTQNILLHSREEAKYYPYPHNAAEVMAKLMNSMIVEIMKGKTHASLKALQGYCYFHRLLIFLCDKYDPLLSSIEKAVQSFINQSHDRNKTNYPNLGELLTKLSVLGPQGFKWESIKKPLIEEIFTRNALWILRHDPKWFHKTSIQDRLAEAWEASEVSMRLVMFHVFFLRNVIERYHGMPLKEIARHYDNRFGRAEPELEDKLQNTIFQIQKIQSFNEFFSYVGLSNIYSTNERIHNLIKKCMQSASLKGYVTLSSYMTSEKQDETPPPTSRSESLPSVQAQKPKQFHAVHFQRNRKRSINTRPQNAHSKSDTQRDTGSKNNGREKNQTENEGGWQVVYRKTNRRQNDRIAAQSSNSKTQLKGDWNPENYQERGREKARGRGGVRGRGSGRGRSQRGGRGR